MKVLRMAAGQFVFILFAVIVIVLAGLEALATRRSGGDDVSAMPRERVQAIESSSWSGRLQAADHAIRVRDLVTADRELQSTYLAALASRRWEGMIAYGDAATRMADVASVRHSWVEKARQAYLIALFRAQDGGSVDGVLRAAEGFHRLQDRSVVELALRVAERMTSAKGQAAVARLHEATARLDMSRIVAEPVH